MALTKEIFDELFIDRYGNINIRTSTVILEDGKEIAKTFHRKVLAPGDDVTVEEERTKVVAATVWTQAVIDDHVARRAAAAISRIG